MQAVRGIVAEASVEYWLRNYEHRYIKILCKVNYKNTAIFLPWKTLFPQTKRQPLYENGHGHFKGNLW